MSDDRDDDPSSQWWGRRGSRQRVKGMVQQMVSNELMRTRLMRDDLEKRSKTSWAKTNAYFDPPQDHAALSARLHLPFTRKVEEPVYQSMAVDEEDEGDDGPPEDYGETGIGD